VKTNRTAEKRISGDSQDLYNNLSPASRMKLRHRQHPTITVYVHSAVPSISSRLILSNVSRINKDDISEQANTMGRMQT
jgi:hypothetical protein